MEEYFEKDSKIIDKNEDEKNRELIRSILSTKKSLIQAHQNFELAESGLVDYYSYNIKAYQTKLDYLIQQAKNKGLIMDSVMKRKIEEDVEVG